MEALVPVCCGLDVHKETVVACLLSGEGDKRPRKQVRSFRTMKSELEQLRDWLREEGCTHVAMESTGVYWMPVFATLEEHFRVIVGNATHIKNVPGRKTDVRDSEWIANLLRHGLIRPSFVPSPPFRKLRELTRYRRTLIHARSAERNRLQRLLEIANIKIRSVASDIFGKSGRAMIEALLRGDQRPEEMAALAKGSMRRKIGDLTLALDGRLDDDDRFLLALQLRRLDDVERDIAEVDARIDAQLEPYAEQRDLLLQIPGIDRTAAAVVLAELGVDMSVFPSVAHAAAWAGVCPGNYESAGKSKAQSIRKGNVHLLTILVQAAVCAANKRGSYLRDKFWKLKARRGAKRAAVAVAHKILVAVYHVLRDRTPYRDLGANYLDRRREAEVRNRLVGRLEDLGFDVRLTPRIA